jgi:chromosome segregation protein
MYFKQIEMHGFKSFADKTVIHLQPGITSIVGPNGCGKSNILDAMRWALGEQSAKALRGSHMQDVIFNGSEQRPAMGMAEVGLTFDNADGKLPVDFTEVTIARRVYRSGESEYLINKAPCRLRDIQELFMDTGIGTAAYSMIGQGKIDLVLSSKPDDRRYLFEEAAGIIKYKTRKRIALKKLESADQNLVRLSDIINEVQRQMRSLKRQVQAAIRHRELTDALRDLEIRNAWLQYNELSNAIADLKQQFATAGESYQKASSQTTSQEAEQERLNLKRVELERMLAARREGEYQVDAEMEKIERQVALLRRDIAFAEEKRTEAVKEHEDLIARAESLKQSESDTGSLATGLREELSALDTGIAEKQAEHAQIKEQAEAAEAMVEKARESAMAAVSARSRTETELVSLANALDAIDKQLAALYQDQQGQQGRQETLANQLNELQRQHTAHEAELAEAAGTREQKQAKRTAVLEELKNLSEQWTTFREQKSSHEARLNSLRELRDSYEGFAVGVRAIMRAKQENMREADGVIGPVGDLISTENDLRHAIEAALGGNINNIVCDQADSAKHAIAFLKKHQAGRVTFLPLDTIRVTARDDTDALSGHPGVIGKAIDFIQCDARVRPAFEYLLYNTVIVQSIDDAIRIARSERRFPKLVTLDGEVVNPAGAVTGGRNKHESQGLLGRSAEIEDLEKRVEETGKRIAHAATKAAHLTQEQEALTGELHQLDQRERAARASIGDSGVSLARVTAELDSLRQSDAQLQSRRDQLVVQREAMETQRKESTERMESMDTDDEALQNRVSQAQEEAARLRQAVAVCGDALADLRVKLASLTQNMEEAERNRIREQRAHADALQEAARRLAQSEQLQVQSKDFEERIADAIERAKALSETKEEAHDKVLEAQREMDAVNKQADAIAKTLRTLREQSDKAQKEVHKIELDLTHKEDRIEFVQETILNEYKVALASLKESEVGVDEFDEKEREDLIKTHRADLKRLGNVNLMAIEEFEALEKRAAFLEAQDKDLRDAREKLMGVVARIDATILEMFMDTFNLVAEQFKTYFRRLFNGGQARVYLLDENDPLESGIEIEARPPGKKPQTISLLSGGEQAMTAIALLFSIFSAKPSPFCVLDEVDAPLDDANIGRFLALVDEFTDNSQFIVITHNKQTMAHAAALFGVTQQERGVSQIVSVKFDGMGAEHAAAV